MNWWQSSSSKSENSLVAGTKGGSNSKTALKSVMFPFFPCRYPIGNLHVSLENHESELSTLTSSAASIPSPHPLPLPSLQRSNHETEHPNRRESEKGLVERKQTATYGIESDSVNGFNSRSKGQDDVKSEEHSSETRLSRKSHRKQDGVRRSSESQTTSPSSSPEKLILQRGLCHQTLVDQKASSAMDNSPANSSPSVRSHRRPRSSPLRHQSSSPNKASDEISLACRESSPNAMLHPLPLPPRTDTILQPPPPILTFSTKHEFVAANSQWQKGRVLGHGTFGCVYVASNRETGALCAMKEVAVLPDDPNSAGSIRQLEQEIKVFSQLKHPNIVQYYGSEIAGDRFYIYLEYVHPGSISRFIHEHGGSITESVVRNFTRHILSGLAYLHSTKTVHRDIKCANLLVDSNGVVKLADFGMAKHLPEQVAALSLKGSPYWMAPELLQPSLHKDASSDHALAVDIWSLGCTIIEMLNGKPPWSEYERVAALFKVLKETPPIPETLSSDGKDFLRCCLRRNPVERSKASALLEHRFVKQWHKDDALSSNNTGIRKAKSAPM